MQDYGYAQGTSTEMLKTYVHNEAVPVLAPHKFQVRIAGDVGLGALSSMPRVQIPAVGAQNTAPSSSVHKPISIGTGSRGKGQKNEIFVDILERLTLTFNSTGYVQHSAIDGCIQMKSYLSGNPALRIALNEVGAVRACRAGIDEWASALRGLVGKPRTNTHAHRACPCAGSRHRPQRRRRPVRRGGPG